jgi:hypothetical protein
VLSPSQRRVLEWLNAWPGVQLAGDIESVSWTAAWASAEARGEAMAFARAIGGTAGFGIPSDLRLLDWPTPACRRGTFRSLLRSGYLKATGQHRTIPFYRWYTISDGGLDALRADRDAGIPMEVEDREPRRRLPTVRCECGWLGYTLKHHTESARHQTWLHVQAYSAKVRAENEALLCQ